MFNKLSKLPTGMFGFTLVWVGQMTSVIASAMSQFALTIWMYDQTKSATAMGLMQVFYMTPFLILTPIAGVMVDRHNRKLMMAVSDMGAGIATAFILALYYFNALQFWHLYVASVVYGAGTAFQWLAYSVATSTMIPKEQLGRANGMMSLVETGPGVVAPILAGILLPVIKLTGILFVDVITFLFALGVLMIVHIPQPERTEDGQQGNGGIWKGVAYGFKYIFTRPGLLGMQLIFLAGNLFLGVGFTVLAPMILTRTNSNSIIFGTVQTAGAIGGVIGSVIVSVWGGFKRRTHGVLIGWIWSGISMSILGIVGGLPIWITGMVLVSVIGPLLNSSIRALWQAKVAPDVQGRVFSARRIISWLATPIAPIIAGTLADFVLEPAMRDVNSHLASTFSWLIGTGPGSGMGLLFIVCGIAIACVGVVGYLIPTIRDMEETLPDHDQFQPSEVSPDTPVIA